MQKIVKNGLVQDESGVWIFEKESEFGYSDGVESEKYLKKVFGTVGDLSNGSSELEGYIKDWPSEYHLSAKRGQLFSGFDFNSTSTVLEVGCGCGAITRYLGETFGEVVSIEGSIHRAKLAKLRTKDLDSVSILCAPFQEIEFSKKFDMIFCIGVYEYSSSFVEGDSPYETVLNYFREMLTPTGICIIAIENQFGLKYFNVAREDHTNSLYEGVEGYQEFGDKVKTFGKNELTNNLKKFFKNTKFYYPYPDYKLPETLVSESFLDSGLAGELVSQIKSRDYYGNNPPLWDESLVSQELSRNGVLSTFANSFLVFASNVEIPKGLFKQEAVIRNGQRSENFRTDTRVYYDINDKLVVSKKLLSGENDYSCGNLQLVESNSEWRESDSLHTVLYKNSISKIKTLREIFEPAAGWIKFLNEKALIIGKDRLLPGSYIDCSWPNFYQNESNISFIDREWVWKSEVKFNVVVIRTIFNFMSSIRKTEKRSPLLKRKKLENVIRSISKSIGVDLKNEDFMDFIAFEAEFQSLVHGSVMENNIKELNTELFSLPSTNSLRDLKKLLIYRARKAYFYRVLARCKKALFMFKRVSK